MRPLVAVFAAAATLALATTSFADSRDALTPWEGSSALSGVQTKGIPVLGGAPIRLKIEMHREHDGHFRKLATTHLRGTVQRCVVVPMSSDFRSELELCGAPRTAVMRTAGGTTELRIVKTRTMRRLVSPLVTETVEEDIGEETIGTATIDERGNGTITGADFSALGAPTIPASGTYLPPHPAR